jgi:hypothetical protein
MSTYSAFWSVWSAALADELLVLRDVVRLQPDAEQVEPELATVALDPVNLKNKTISKL